MYGAKRAVQREARIATLRLVQEATDVSDTHRVTVELDDGATRWSATAHVRLGLDQVELDRLRWQLEDYPQYPIDPAPEIGVQVEGRLVELGRELFGQVLTNQEATQLPWGLLRDPQTNTPLALWAGAFVRSNPRPARLLARPDRTVERLRVLLVICRPGGGGDVPFRSVASQLVRVSDDARQVFDLDVLRPPTFATLGKVLRAAAGRGQPYDVVHFDGHGTWADLAQVGVTRRRSSPLHPRPGVLATWITTSRQPPQVAPSASPGSTEPPCG